jgi:hypothetical protein
MSQPSYQLDHDKVCGCDPLEIECEWFWDEELECWICIHCAVVQ